MVPDNKKNESNSNVKEWNALCLQIAAENVAAESDFPSNPLKSQKLQRQEQIASIAETLQMQQYQKSLSIGIDALLCQPGIKDRVTAVLQAYVEGLERGISPDRENQTQEDFATALDLNKDTLLDMQKVGSELLAAEQWEKALGVFTLLTLWQHTSPLHWFHRSLAFYFSEQPLEALASVEVALLLSSEQPEYHLVKSVCLLQLDRREEAAQVLQHVQKIINSYNLQLSAEWTAWKMELNRALGLK